MAWVYLFSICSPAGLGYSELSTYWIINTRTCPNLLKGTKQEVFGGTFRGTQAGWRLGEGE